MSGRKGTPGHQNLIRMACMKLLNEVLGDDFLSISFIRENALDVKTSTHVNTEHSLGDGYRVATAELRMYADVACAVVYDPDSKWGLQKEVNPELVKIVNKHFADGKMEEYRSAVRSTYGMMFYIIECEINPASNLLRDGPKLTAYRLIKQQNNNLKLILAVFQGTPIEHPEIFDAVWEFPRKGEETENEDDNDVISKFKEARKTIRSELYKNRFAVRAMFSGGICLCGAMIETGELITRPPHALRWMHVKCAELDASDSKTPSKASRLAEKLAEQATRKQAVWRDDLLELAKVTFLGQWGIDFWIEDTIITTQILDLFGLHKLTAGWRFQSDKARQKYAQKIEKEFARHKGWICRLCRRTIYVDKSVERGIGPVCFKKHP
jgi:hypothetical protein